MCCTVLRFRVVRALRALGVALLAKHSPKGAGPIGLELACAAVARGLNVAAWMQSRCFGHVTLNPRP